MGVDGSSEDIAERTRDITLVNRGVFDNASSSLLAEIAYKKAVSDMPESFTGIAQFDNGPVEKNEDSIAYFANQLAAGDEPFTKDEAAATARMASTSDTWNHGDTDDRGRARMMRRIARGELSLAEAFDTPAAGAYIEQMKMGRAEGGAAYIHDNATNKTGIYLLRDKAAGTPTVAKNSRTSRTVTYHREHVDQGPNPIQDKLTPATADNWDGGPLPEGHIFALQRTVGGSEGVSGKTVFTSSLDPELAQSYVDAGNASAYIMEVPHSHPLGDPSYEREMEHSAHDYLDAHRQWQDGTLHREKVEQHFTKIGDGWVDTDPTVEAQVTRTSPQLAAIAERETKDSSLPQPPNTV